MIAMTTDPSSTHSSCLDRWLQHATFLLLEPTSRMQAKDAVQHGWFKPLRKYFNLQVQQQAAAEELQRTRAAVAEAQQHVPPQEGA